MLVITGIWISVPLVMSNTGGSLRYSSLKISILHIPFKLLNVRS